jgi:gliding motility-associated-like protein
MESEGFIIQWENGSNILQVDTPGVYTFNAVNTETGCKFSKSVLVFDQEIPYVVIDSFYTFCREDLSRFILPQASVAVENLQWIYPAQGGKLQVFAEKTDTYLLRVEGGVCVDTIEVGVEVLSCTGPCQIFIPEAFSPNDDGINDFFEIFIGCRKNIFKFKITIFDRWGNMVFQSDEFNHQWDGNIEGKMAQVGGYTYKLKMTLESENEFEEVFREGFIGLIR